MCIRDRGDIVGVADVVVDVGLLVVVGKFATLACLRFGVVFLPLAFLMIALPACLIDSLIRIWAILLITGWIPALIPGPAVMIVLLCFYFSPGLSLFFFYLFRASYFLVFVTPSGTLVACCRFSWLITPSGPLVACYRLPWLITGRFHTL